MTNDQSAPRGSGDDVEDLAAVLQVTEGIVAGVRPEQASLPTPCPDYDVSAMVDHLVGYATNFADRANGVEPPADPDTTRAGEDPPAAYHEAAMRMLDGYRGGPAEGATPIGVALMEVVTHGWDLAKATGQPTPYPDRAVEAVITAGQGMLGPQYRGPDMPFGEEVEVPASAPAIDRLAGFMGRDPAWSA